MVLGQAEFSSFGKVFPPRQSPGSATYHVWLKSVRFDDFLIINPCGFGPNRIFQFWAASTLFYGNDTLRSIH